MSRVTTRSGPVATCMQCGKTYTTWHSSIKSKYCSEACANLGRRRKRHLTCKECGKPFTAEPSREAAKYCSRACMQKALWGGENRVSKVCPICSSEFRVKPTQFDDRIYCSLHCRSVARWGTDSHKHNWACGICGKTSYIRPSLVHRRKTCGNACWRKWMSITRMGENGVNWKGGITPLLRYLRASKPMRHWSKVVLASNDGKCAHCGELATEAHHIESVISLLEEMLDPTNGIPYCANCHSSQANHPTRPARRPSEG